MSEENIYYMVRKKAIPEVLLKVLEAKKLLQTGKADTVQGATELVGISRSSFYKYQEDIMEFHDSAEGTTLTLSVQMEDEPGLLSELLQIAARYRANILTIHQSIPVNGSATISLSVQLLSDTEDVSGMLRAMEQSRGIQKVRVLAKG